MRRRLLRGCFNSFPGVGLGVLAAKSLRVTDEDMYIAAKTLAELVRKFIWEGKC